MLINAGKDIFIKSGAGNIDASCLNDIRLTSVDGSVSSIQHSFYIALMKVIEYRLLQVSASPFQRKHGKSDPMATSCLIHAMCIGIIVHGHIQ